MNVQTHQGGRARPRNGVTLIELLVVLAIIGVLAGIAVPAFMASGALDTDPLRTSARDLFRMLRSANLYALRHNVNTALIYTIEIVEDPLREAAYDAPSAFYAPRITGYAVARQLTEKEASALKLVQSDLPAFTPLQAEEGQFVRFGENTILAHAPYAPLDGINYIGPGAEASHNYAIGLVPVKLYDIHEREDTGQLYYERIAPAIIPPDAAAAGQDDGARQIVPPALYDSSPPRLHYGSYDDDAGAFVVQANTFPAHVFRSDGVLAKTALTAKERVVLAMAPGPGALESERYVEAPTLEQPEGQRTPYQLIEIYASSGRIKWMGAETLSEETPE